MKYELKICLIAFIAYSLLFLLTIYSYDWFIPTPSFLLIAIVISVITSVKAFYSWSLKLPRLLNTPLSFIVGIITLYVIFCVSGITTNFLGKPFQEKLSVISYHKDYPECVYRLKLNGLNPLGGFCVVEKFKNRLNNDAHVNLIIKETVLGKLVVSIRPTSCRQVAALGRKRTLPSLTWQK